MGVKFAFWSIAALLLFAAEAMAPGAFMLWFGFAAAAMAVVVLVAGDKPLLNQRANQLIGHVTPLDQAIVNGRGRVQIADAFWVVEGPDLPAAATVRVVAVDGMTLKVQEA